MSVIKESLEANMAEILGNLPAAPATAGKELAAIKAEMTREQSQKESGMSNGRMAWRLARGIMVALVTWGLVVASAQAQTGDYVIYVSAGASGSGTETAPYGTIGQALDDVAAYRNAGGAAHAVIQVAPGEYVEQVSIEPVIHRDLSLLGSTVWNVDAVGRLDDVAADETLIAFVNLPDDPGVLGDNDGKGYVVWVRAHDVTLEDFVIEARGLHFPPTPTQGLILDRVKGAVVRRVWARGGFARVFARGSHALLDRVLVSRGNAPPLVGISLGGGSKAEGLGGRYVLDRCRARDLSTGFEFQAHGNTYDPIRIFPSGLETNVVYANECVAENNGRGFTITAHLPDDRPEPLTVYENRGRMDVHLDECRASGNGYGIRLRPDPFGFSNPGEPGLAARTSISLLLTGTTLEGSSVTAAQADGANADYLRLSIYDPDGAASSILCAPDYTECETGYTNWVNGSKLFYNRKLVAPRRHGGHGR